MTGTNWYQLDHPDEVPSPALLFYPDRIEANIRAMIDQIGDPRRLRPHIKTHKSPDVLQLHLKHRIHQFKCATIAEAEMAGLCGATEVLLAYQPVGPAIDRLFQLVRQYPGTRFATVFDHPQILEQLNRRFAALPKKLDLFLDLDVGMARTGISPGAPALALYRAAANSPNLSLRGLHVYDGHIQAQPREQRSGECNAAVELMVVGGTPTFPIHSRRQEVQCSPGTCVLWDAGYQDKFPDLKFLPAALVLTRVISKPASDCICLDLGHKSIASERPHPRVRFLDRPDLTPVVHSEEHLVMQGPGAADAQVGDCWYGIPWHICPTVALYSEASAVRDRAVVGTWKIQARDRRLTV
jgi:D-serine deaminase-like pyridoxal phosphate-dependent protein